MPAKITLDQLKEHTKKESFYALIHGKVYDVTKFLDEHPGGDEVLMAEGGKDATEAFEDVGHSDEARDILRELYVGDFEAAPLAAPKINPSPSSKPASLDSGSPSGQVSSPPELPPYLKKVYDLRPIVGAPSDEEVIGIHAVIRVANKVVDVQDMGDPTLLARLSEHLFNVQMTRYRNKYLGNVFPENTTYAPPTLPAHLSVKLAPVAGSPSEEEVIQVQSAIRAYQQYANSPSIFDPHVDMELSQHLFDIQMARYAQRARQSHTSPMHQETPSLSSVRIIERTADVADEPDTATNNAGTGADAFGVDHQVHVVLDSSVCDVIERSNRLAEQANQLARRSSQLIERSNQIAERSNQLVERSTQPTEQSNKLAKRFNEIFERFNEHLETSNQLAAESTNYAERIGDVLENINRVLVKVQHAIVRVHKGNTKFAVDCLVNERGEVPGASETVGWWDLKSLSEDCADEANARIPILIEGVERYIRFPDRMLGDFLYFYGIGEGLFKTESSNKLKSGKAGDARERLRAYWASCLS